MTLALILAAAAVLATPGTASSQASDVPAPPAEARQALAPGAVYDARIPTLKAVVGHDVGEVITTPDQMVAYLRALAAAAPDRAALIEYGRSWEGRPLHVLAVGSPARIGALDEVKAGMRRLADPRGVAAPAAEALVNGLPVVVWLIHGVHGNEISSGDAALALAYHLLAAQGDAAVESIRREAIVLIDPAQNPDGRARFVQHYAQSRAASPDAEPASAEHDEPWPGGRPNHYLFDMNRDWFAQSQPETRARTAFYLEWFPQVVVDLHEMGGDSTYYFAPPADPLNPYITREQAGWFETFGRENGRRFDERGFAYFIRETFDSFYPGYGESWPIFHGSVGMTYEQASARGLVWRRRDDSLLTYRESIVPHFTAALQTAQTAAANRARLLRDFAEYRRSAIALGERGPVREYLVPPGADAARAHRLGQLLAQQGLEVRRSTVPIALGTRTLPAGTLVVPAAQPGNRLLRNLLDPSVPQPEAFVKEQERRRRKRLPDQIYDVTAWSLPLAWDIEVLTSERPTGVATEALPAGPGASQAPALPPARVGYLARWGTGTAAVAAAALRAGAKLRVADAPFTLAGREYGVGTVFVRTSDLSPEARATLAVAASRHAVPLDPVEATFTESGISLGSDRVLAMKAPRVVLAWDEPTASTSAGWARYVLERRFEQPVTVIRTRTLGRVDLRRFDVLVLPAGNYGDALGGETLRRLKDWITGGGTLITLGEASRWAARENVGLLDTVTELRGGKPEREPAKDEKPKDAATDPAKPFDLEAAIQPERDRPDFTPGAMLRVQLDPEHWLSSGTDGEIQAIVESQRIFTPIKLDKGRNVGVYAPRERVLASGLAWDQAQQQLAQKAYLIDQPMGRGRVIAFAEDPNYRAFVESSELLFINAVLLGPAHTR